MLSTKNPMFQNEADFRFFTARRGNKLLGRICVHHHRDFNLRFTTNTAYFGFFECVDEQEVANVLLTAAEDWARQKGFDTLAGNFNLSAMQEMGMVVNGFQHAPYTAQLYSQPYYPALLEKSGYSPTFPMKTFEVPLEKLDTRTLLGKRQEELLQNPDYRFIPITKSTYKRYKKEMVEVFNQSFSENALFVPFTEAQFDFQAADLLYFMDEHISVLVLHKGSVVAMSFHVPDINPFLKSIGSRLGWLTLWKYFKHKRKRDRVLCIFSAVLPAYQNTGIVGAISFLSTRWMKFRGYKRFGITWVHEENVKSLKKVENMGGEQLHELRIFEKHLSQ